MTYSQRLRKHKIADNRRIPPFGTGRRCRVSFSHPVNTAVAIFDGARPQRLPDILAFGTVLPFPLHRLVTDPALAGSAMLTSVTGVVGLLAFLGLAARYLL